MWNPLTQHTYLYNIMHENAELIKIILFNKYKGAYVGKGSHSLHYYQIKLIKNISGSEQGGQSLQKKSC